MLLKRAVCVWKIVWRVWDNRGRLCEAMPTVSSVPYCTPTLTLATTTAFRWQHEQPPQQPQLTTTNSVPSCVLRLSLIFASMRKNTSGLCRCRHLLRLVARSNNCRCFVLSILDQLNLCRRCSCKRMLMSVVDLCVSSRDNLIYPRHTSNRRRRFQATHRHHATSCCWSVGVNGISTRFSTTCRARTSTRHINRRHHNNKNTRTFRMYQCHCLALKKPNVASKRLWRRRASHIGVHDVWNVLHSAVQSAAFTLLSTPLVLLVHHSTFHHSTSTSQRRQTSPLSSHNINKSRLWSRVNCWNRHRPILSATHSHR
mmetsp:Transcript_19834/g.34031  ORF Transcript_19834/g.34031 Transcript_19834/m.34031 type:complete len:313 (+) Transcript_19834:5600-6538(+)